MGKEFSRSKLRSFLRTSCQAPRSHASLASSVLVKSSHDPLATLTLPQPFIFLFPYPSRSKRGVVLTSSPSPWSQCCFEAKVHVIGGSIGSSHPPLLQIFHDDYTAGCARSARNVVLWMAFVRIPECLKVRSLSVDLFNIRRPSARLPALL